MSRIEIERSSSYRREFETFVCDEVEKKSNRNLIVIKYSGFKGKNTWNSWLRSGTQSRKPGKNLRDIDCSFDSSKFPHVRSGTFNPSVARIRPALCNVLRMPAVIDRGTNVRIRKPNRFNATVIIIPIDVDTTNRCIPMAGGHIAYQKPFIVYILHRL